MDVEAGIAFCLQRVHTTNSSAFCGFGPHESVSVAPRVVRELGVLVVVVVVVAVGVGVVVEVVAVILAEFVHVVMS